MKSFLSKITLLSILLLTSFSSAWASIFNTNTSGWGIFWGWAATSNPYCNSWDCWLQQGIDTVRWNLDGVVTDPDIGLADYIQSIIVYLLWFLSIIAIIYIIYAGFVLLTSGWDEEKTKTTKNTILYVIIGLVIIWLAGPITTFVFRVLNDAQTI